MIYKYYEYIPKNIKTIFIKNIKIIYKVINIFIKII